MKVAILRAVLLCGLLASSLLLVSAADCSFNKSIEPAVSVEQGDAATLNQGGSSGVVEQVTEPGVEHSMNPTADGQEVRDESNDQDSRQDAPGGHADEVTTTNAFCAACHYGFDEEEFALNHELWGVGCERCHGESMRHRSDENNTTPPEIMWPESKINPMCMMCHHRDHIKHVPQHEELLAVTATIFDPEIDDGSGVAGGADIRCTTCHAETHRLNVRTVRWNRMTGEMVK